jgi:hypothetical protein
MHRLKWEWESITTFNQFVASFVNPFRSKNVLSFVPKTFLSSNTFANYEKLNTG